MDAETRTKTAITITRDVLKKALTSPFTMAVMTAEEMNPERVEDVVYLILCYLEKTKPQASTEGLGIDTIKEDV